MSSYLQALSDAKQQMERLLKQRTEIDQQLVKLKQTIEALSALCERPVPELDPQPRATLLQEIGITDAIRKVMFESKLPMTVPQIRDGLLNIGYDVNQYSNGLTVIHNTVNRMEKQGEVTPVRTASGVSMGWLYQGNYGAPNSLANQFARARENLTPRAGHKGFGQRLVEAHKRALDKKK